MNNKVLKLIADSALKVTTQNVNSACLWYWHQPKLPENAGKLKKK